MTVSRERQMAVDGAGRRDAVAVAGHARALRAAQSWPNRPVRFIVTLGPGSGVDIGARLFADKLSARWGQPVVVENRPGGDGMVAITSVPRRA